MDDNCAFCCQPIVTKTRQDTDFVYRCGHKVHTRCVAAYLESSAPVNNKFRCPICRGPQSTWFPTRVCRTRAVQSTNATEADEWEKKTVVSFFECAYVNSFRPSRVGFDRHNLRMVKIPEMFDVDMCTRNIKMVLLGMLGKASFENKEEFNAAVEFSTAAVTMYIEARELRRLPRNGTYFEEMRKLLFC